MKKISLLTCIILLCLSLSLLFGSNKNCLYVVNTPDQNILSILNQLGFNATSSNTIPSNLSSYDLVICREYSACTPTTATYVGNFVKNGGGAILMGGTPSIFGGGWYDCSNIADWFGTSQYSNVGVSDARVAIDYPLETSLVKNDVIEHCSGWGGAAVENVVADVTVLAMWDYGSGNIHSFIRSHQNGRVAFWAGDVSFNDKNKELFKAICQWTGKILPSTYQCLYVINTPDPNMVAILNQLNFNVTTSSTIQSNLATYNLVICREYSACNPSTAGYVGDFVKNGGGAILMGGTPSTFGGGGYSCYNIADWFGTGQYSNVGISDAKVDIDYPLGTSLFKNDVIEHCGGWGGAAVKNVAADATVLAMWDYGSGNIHSFIRSHQNGRVAFWAGDVSYNNKNQELFKALCKWTANIRTSIKTNQMNELPESYHLFQNFPNPFNPTTTIEYQIMESNSVRLIIYNIHGERVKQLVNQQQSPGEYSVVWDGTDERGYQVSSGIYIYRIQTAGWEKAKRMLLIR